MPLLVTDEMPGLQEGRLQGLCIQTGKQQDNDESGMSGCSQSGQQHLCMLMRQLAPAQMLLQVMLLSSTTLRYSET